MKPILLVLATAAVVGFGGCGDSDPEKTNQPHYMTVPKSHRTVCQLQQSFVRCIAPEHQWAAPAALDCNPWKSPALYMDNKSGPKFTCWNGPDIPLRGGTGDYGASSGARNNHFGCQRGGPGSGFACRKNGFPSARFEISPERYQVGAGAGKGPDWTGVYPQR